MPTWACRKKRVRATFDEIPLNYIPMIAKDNEEELFKKIRKAFDESGVKKIIILDPYFSPSDIAFLINCFSSVIGRSIIIYTRLKFAGNSEQETEAITETNAGTEERVETKREQALKRFEEIIQRLESKGIFQSVRIRVPKLDFHDRYIFSSEEIYQKVFLASGSSINTIGKGYSSIQNIQNNFFRNQVLKLVNILEASLNGN
ncbi:MAG: hypothetical protein ACOYXC_09150 [Candidatus Rifleibacteriota bacterium]